MKYCSYECRKVLEKLSEYGIEIAADEWFDIEIAVDAFWTTHVIGVIEQVLTGGDPAKKLAKIELMGWAYFHKPIASLLGSRSGALRPESVFNGTVFDWTRTVYNMVTGSFCRADFNMKEMALINAMTEMVKDPHQFSRAKEACRDNRSIYYLHGVLRREYDSARGKIREIQETTDTSSGWTPPEGYEQMDVIERKTLEREWADRLNSLRISQALNDA